jgi:serine/threonine-protein phosphatase Stp1
MIPNLRLEASGLSHEGLVRVANEDSMLQRDDLGLWVVADGMGGHEGGRFASTTVVAALSALDPATTGDAMLDAASRAVHSANQTIFEAGSAGHRMGTTVAALVVHEEQFTCFWAGDSRVYLLRDSRLFRLTRDHTQVQDMVEAGLLSPEEAATHPMSHVLSRAVGVEADLQLEAVRDVVRPRDVFLLCSDGLYGVVSDAEIADHLARYDPASACRLLVDQVLARGAPDNVTVIAVVCQEATALAFTPA